MKLKTKSNYLHYFISISSGRERSCSTKINYHTEKRALEAANEMQIKTGKQFKAYPCFFCHGFHIAHKH